MASLRNDILQYAEHTFGTEPDYPWARDPDSAVLRHSDTAKWYGLILSVAGQKLGRNTHQKTDILNVKCDPVLLGSLLGQPGYLPAYHMNKGNWLTILLDGTVPLHDIIQLLHLSFELTDKKKKGRIK